MPPPPLKLGVDFAADRVVHALEEGRRAWVVGSPSTGRSKLVDRLAERIEGRVVALDLLEQDEPDAAIGGLLSAAGLLEDEAKRRAVMRDWSSIEAGVAEVAKGVGHDATFIVKVPESWVRPDEALNPWSRHARERARSLLGGLGRVDARVVWITPRSVKPHELGLADDEARAIGLPAPENARSLLRTVAWGRLTGAALALDRALPATVDPSPVCLRLAVGVVSLGFPAEALVEPLRQKLSACVADLVDRLVGRLQRPENARLRNAVSCLLLARRPIARSAIASCTGAAVEDLSFVCDVVAYGDENVKMSAPVRAQLRSHLHDRSNPMSIDAVEAAHRALSSHFEVLDGKREIAATQSSATVAWLEKEHHRAHTSDAALDASYLPARELYWDRGRHLSIERKDFAAAARVYEACVERFPDDAYAWHYLGYNLERAGKSRTQAQGAFRRAIDLDRTNPWWNGRLVQFAIRQGRPLEAEQSWDECLENVDPEGTRIAESRWLAEHLHGNVVQAWLSAGDAARAFRVLKLLPDVVIDSSRELSELRERVLDAVEADAIGESVYASTVATAKRWTSEPRYLPSVLDEGKLERWYPGRIVEASREGVRIVYACREVDSSYTSFVSDFDSAAWNALRLGPPERASGFVEVGLYCKGSQTHHRVAFAEQDDSISPAPLLAYFDRWRSPT